MATSILFPDDYDDLLASPYASDLVIHTALETLDMPCAYEFSLQEYCYEFGLELPLVA